MVYLYNCKIYTGDSVLSDKAICLDNEVVREIIPVSEIPNDAERIDLKGLNVAPGFIDLQVNGGGGVLFNNTPTVDGLKEIFDAHMQFGTTNLLPTFITGEAEKMKIASKAVQDIIKDGHLGILGIHFEGPLISSESKGVHNPEYITNTLNNGLENAISIKEGKILLTLAPEVIDYKMIQQLKSEGVILSAGHTDATFDEAQKGFENGITGATHLYNAMCGIHHREPGMVGAVLYNDNVWAGIIPDGFHVNFAAIKIAYKCKQGKLYIVTDSMPPVGMVEDNAEYILDGLKTRVNNGICVNEDGTIAGSVLDMSTAVRNCINYVGIEIDEALRMASTYPAEFIGLGDKYGYIKSGYKANLTIFDDNIDAKAVVLGGKYIDIKE